MNLVFLAAGLLTALGLASGLARTRARATPGPSPASGAGDETELARRELAGLREQLAAGELSESDYRELRERLAARLAAKPARRTAAPKAQRRTGLWVAGMAAALLAAVLLVLPAVRTRAPGAGPSGNDFVGARAPPRPAAAAPAMTAAGLAAMLRRAVVLDGQGKLDEAITIYRTALSLLPDQADLRAQLGFALARVGRAEEGLAQLRLAVGAAPRLAAARLYLGAILWKQGRRAEARSQWRRYLVLDPHGRGARFVRRTLGEAGR